MMLLPGGRSMEILSGVPSSAPYACLVAMI